MHLNSVILSDVDSHAYLPHCQHYHYNSPRCLSVVINFDAALVMITTVIAFSLKVPGRACCARTPVSAVRPEQSVISSVYAVSTVHFLSGGR